jgi:hypothetical protein
MGEELTVTRPIMGGTATAALPLAGKDQTLIAVTATQPVTPLLKIREVVNLARADENIARAKARMPVAEVANAVEKNHYELLVEQRRLILVEFKQRKMESKHLIASNTFLVPNLDDPEPTSIETSKALIEASSKVKELTASLNELLGWAPDTVLELVPPAPLVESISLKEVTDKLATGNAEVSEAEQNVAKARAGSKLSNLEYVPDVAVMGGYVCNSNAVPLLPRDFSYIGFMATYNLFAFGKREHFIVTAVKGSDGSHCSSAAAMAKFPTAFRSCLGGITWCACIVLVQRF